MGLRNRVSVSCLVMRSPSIGLVFRFLWRYVGSKLDVYKWTGKNDYVALCEPLVWLQVRNISLFYLFILSNSGIDTAVYYS